jgi:carbon monoxide dehydrogenase subunit G
VERDSGEVIRITGGVAAMMKMTKTMHVDAEPEEVMSMLLDSSVNPPGMTMAPVYEGPTREGGVYEWSFKLAGTTQKGLMIITEYVPGERMSSRNLGAIESTSTMTFEPEDGGTRVTVDGASRLTIPLIGRFLDPFLKRGMIKNMKWTMRQVELRHAKQEAAAT